MRVALPLLLVMLVALPARAQDRPDGLLVRPVTVAQLEQVLAQAAGESDRRLAKKLSNLELTQRLSDFRWERWDAKLPGNRSRAALQVIADASAFLALPATDLPDRPPPDLPTQRRIMAKSVDYVLKLTHILPNLFATRVTLSFRSVSRDVVAHSGWGMIAIWQPMKLVGRSAIPVTYRDGNEIEGSAANELRPNGKHPLVTSGEFGPILDLVLSDAGHAQLGWGHWEHGVSGLEAVFDYSVPLAQSHYQPGYCCVLGRISEQRMAYYGEIAVDPSTGVILWLTLGTNPPPGVAILWTGTMVRYGPVELGGKTYLCPLRSVSISQSMPEASIHPFGSAPPLNADPYTQGSLQTLLNDTVFEDYHLFRATVRMLPPS